MRGFIFDMDGTLLNTNGLWWALPGELLNREGLACPEDLKKSLGVEEYVLMTQKLQAAGALPWDMAETWRRYYLIMDELYAKKTTLTEGADGFLRMLSDDGIPCCVATATQLSTAQIALDRTGLTPYLRFAISTHNLGIDKSQSEFFELVAERLGLDIRECVVVEDALYAAKGAKCAGAKVWAIEDRWMSRDWECIRQVADRSFRDFVQMGETYRTLRT